jgi:hypothetical protein
MRERQVLSTLTCTNCNSAAGNASLEGGRKTHIATVLHELDVSTVHRLPTRIRNIWAFGICSMATEVRSIVVCIHVPQGGEVRSRLN